MASNRLLLVEDNFDLAESLASALEDYGFQVQIALNGEEGLRMAKELIPDLIILDLKLPRLSGEEVCRTVKEHEREDISQIPILILTGQVSDVDRIVTKVIGADYFMTKPFELGELVHQIQHLLKPAA